MNVKTQLLVTLCASGLFACATVESYVERVIDTPVGSETVQNIYVEDQSQDQSQEQYVVEDRTEQNRTSRQETRVYENQAFGIERYDEDALNDYVDGLKGAVQFLSAMQTSNSPVVMQGAMLLGLVQGQIKTAKIEIEEWPLAAREKAWEIQGSRITKYNELISFEKKRILSDEAYDASFRRTVGSINLITKESLLAQY
jgi:hypothetical protein